MVRLQGVAETRFRRIGVFKPFLLNDSGWADVYRGQTSSLEWLLLLPEMDQA